MSNKHRRIGKFLSLVLRHQPDKIGIELDAQGWTDVDILIDKMNAKGNSLNRELLDEIVANNNKKRYSYNETGDKIRATQGHSVSIDLGYVAQQPPAVLYHGTATRFLDSILQTGLEKRNRHHVHLSDNLQTAAQVGKRHGKLVLLEVHAQAMFEAGFEFFVSDNGVWLTDAVPPRFLAKKTTFS